MINHLGAAAAAREARLAARAALVLVDSLRFGIDARVSRAASCDERAENDDRER